MNCTLRILQQYYYGYTIIVKPRLPKSNSSKVNINI